MVILAYDQLEDGVLPEVEVLINTLSYFGPLPLALFNHMGDRHWSYTLVQLDQSFDEENPRMPFALWRDIEGLEPSDKEFFGRILNLDPGLRPSAEELLNDERFHLALTCSSNCFVLFFFLAVCCENLKPTTLVA